LRREFNYQRTNNGWTWQSANQIYAHLPLPRLIGEYQLQNAAGVLMTISLLQSDFSISTDAIHQGLVCVRLPGRFQILPNRVPCILDVAHNPLGVQVLRQTLQAHPCLGRTHAIVGILQDKDSAGMLSLLSDIVDCWHIAPLPTPRSCSVAQLMSYFQQLGITQVHSYSSIADAYQQVLSQVSEQDRIVVFGSFYTVSAVLDRYVLH
jgi:dihydrofolate synthase/folylpolyglutamate synthase